ncbi:MAG TPA: hypothetical protein VH834_13645, partial [Solirubrobacteraceae bacterium]
MAEVVEELLQLVLLVHQAERVVRPLADEVRRRGEPAAVDDDVGAGDVGGLVAGQEQRRVADVLGLAGPTQQHLVGEHVPLCLLDDRVVGDLGGHVGLDPARLDD